MIKFDDLSPAKLKWLTLVELLFPEIYANDTISVSELKTVHNHFLELRKTDAKYKVSWPIWLITNNALERGVYVLPKPNANLMVESSREKHEYFAEYESELRQFGVIT